MGRYIRFQEITGGLPLDERYINGREGQKQAQYGQYEGNSDHDVHDEYGEPGARGRVPRKGERAALVLTPIDVIGERMGRRQQRTNPIPKRGAITGWSRRSRRNLKLTLRGVEGMTHVVTLTYPADCPTDPDTLRNHWERIRKWLTRRGYRGVWKREVQRRGALHYHLLIGGGEGEFDAAELGRAWAKITGNTDPSQAVHITPLETQEKLAAYLSKFDALAAEGAAVGRYWGTFGKAEIAVKAEVVGEAADVAKIARVARGIERAARRKAGHQARRDSGQWARVYWGAARSLLANLPRLVELFGIGERVTITGGKSSAAGESRRRSVLYPDRRNDG